MKARQRSAWVSSVAAAIALAVPAACTAATATIGSDLGALPGAGEGVCAFSGPAGHSRTCTEAQLQLTPGHLAPGGLKARAAGTILRWSVRSGTPSPSTARVKLRLRALDGEDEPGPATPFVELPLDPPGIHTFPAQLPVEKGDRLAVETVVTTLDGGVAYAPIAHLEPGVGSLTEWGSTLFPTIEIAPDSTREDAELLLSADLDFDRTPPRTKLTYPVRQNFLVEKKVLIHLRSNEAATAIASGQLEIPSRHAIFGLYGVKAAVGAGKRVTLRLRLAKNTLKAARLAYANGRKIVIKVTTSASDAAGNDSGVAVATIRPTPPRR
jgi:hypothetical protein